MVNSTLANRLWVVTTAITLSVILYIQIGTGLAIQFSFVSGIALLGWWLSPSKGLLTHPSLVSYYIGSVVSLLVLNTLRYATQFGLSTHRQYAHLFHPDYANTYTHWFVIQVCLPVSLLLLGGYFVSKQTDVGVFFGWWGFLYGLTESLLQFVLEVGPLPAPTYWHILAVLTAMVLFALCMAGLLQLIRPRGHPLPVEATQPLTARQINLWSLLWVSLVVVYAATLYVQAGPLPVGVIMGSMLGGLMGWRKTTARHPADPYKVVPLYLLLQGLFYVHVGEEVLTHFNRAIASLSGHAWSDPEFDYLITLIGPVIWVLAAYSLWKRQAFGNFILWFMIVGMMLGEPTHLLVFPIVRILQDGVNYTYFPGMYTALFPMIPAILALVLIIQDHREWRAIQTTPHA